MIVCLLWKLWLYHSWFCYNVHHPGSCRIARLFFYFFPSNLCVCFLHFYGSYHSCVLHSIFVSEVCSLCCMDLISFPYEQITTALLSTIPCCRYLHDVIYITCFVQLSSIISEKFWYIYLVVSFLSLSIEPQREIKRVTESSHVNFL